MKCKERTGTPAPGDMPHIGGIYREDISDQSSPILTVSHERDPTTIREFSGHLLKGQHLSLYSDRGTSKTTVVEEVGCLLRLRDPDYHE